MRSIFKYIASLQFTILLLSLLIVGMFLGTLFPQGGTPEQYEEAFGEVWSGILSYPGLFDIFHSWWFITLAILLLVNLIAGNLSALWMGRQRDRNPAKGGVEVEASPEKIENTVGILEEMRFRCKRIGDSFIIARKGIARRPISIGFHLCLVLLAVGFFLSATSRFDDMVYLREGEMQRIPFTKSDSLDMTLEKFEMEYIPLGERYFPRDYKSTVSLSTGQRKIVEVNKPLKYRGLTIYQMDYEQRFDLVVGDTTIPVAPRESFAIPGLMGEYKTGTVYLGTLFHEGEQETIVPNTKLYKAEKPDAPPMMRGGKEVGKLVLGEPFEFQDTTLEMKNVAQISGLFYRKDTGYPFVFYALILFMAGLFVRVFFPSYTLRIFVDRPKGAIFVAGRTAGVTADIEPIIDRLEGAFA